MLTRNPFTKSLTWILLISIIIAAGYLLIMLNAADGRPVAPLDDAYIHYQYARQMALGQPWQYNPGDPISTGATSLIYPFLLSVAYRLGFQEDAVVWPALLIGAASLILSAVLIYKITFKLFMPQGETAGIWRSRIAGLTALLFLLTGAIPWSYLNGMETGLFSLFILAALHGFVADRPGQSAFFLVLTALVRPEGIFLAGVAWLVSTGQFLSDRQRYRRQLWFMTLALLLASIPYLVNIALTGTPVATGAQAKSWLGNVPFVLADLIGNMGRMVYFILERMTLGFLASKPWPVVPGLLILALFGALVLWRRENRWVVLLVAGWFTVGTILAATLITALWQIGRYQVPFLAILMPLAGVGIGTLLVMAKPSWRKALYFAALLWGLLVFYSSFLAGQVFYDGVASMLGQQVALGDTINRQLEEDVTVAVHDAGAIRYLGNRNTYDMIGLTTQGVADAWRHGSGAIFEIMERSAKRPTHFATYPDVGTIPYFAETSLFAKELYATEPYGPRTANSAGPIQVLYEADWGPAENSQHPRQENMSTLTGDMTQALSIDLADLTDEEEKKLSWSIGRTQPGFPTEARQFSFQTDPQEELLDGGRLISGKLTFPVQVTPNQELTLVARLHPDEAGAMAVQVNGRDAGLWRYPAMPGRWLETLYQIPEDLIDDSLLDIELQLVDEEGTAKPIGVYHLWAYQGPRHIRETIPQVILRHQLGSQILLQGYDLPTKTLEQGEDLSLTLYWSAEDPPDRDAKVFLHIYDDQGDLVAQVDQRPFHDTRPPYSWLPGEQIADPYQIALPPDVQPGVYDIAVGLYDPISNERLGVTTTGGEPLPDNRIFIDNIVLSSS